MFSQLYYQTIAVIYTVSRLVGPNPMKYIFKVHRFQVTPVSRRRCAVHGFIMMSGTIVVGIRAYQAKLNGEMNNFKMALVLVYGTILVNIAFFNYICYPYQLAALCNGFLNFGDFFNRIWMMGKNPEKSKANWYWERCLIFLAINCVLSLLIVCSHYYLFPLSVYPLALLPQVMRDNTLVYLLLGLICNYAAAIAWMSLIFPTAILGSYFVFIIPLITTEFKSNRSDYRTTRALRDPKNLARVYRSIEILHKCSMKLFGILMVPIQFVIGQGILTSNCILIRDWAKLDSVTKGMLICITISLQAFWFTVLSYSGLFHKQSVATLKSWKYFNFPNAMDAKYISKFRKSCRPLGVGTEGYFIVRRVTVLKFMMAIVRGTFRALLALKSV